MQTSIVIVSGSIIHASTVHLNGIWHLMWRYISKPVLGGHPVLSGHYSIPRGCPLNTGFTVASFFRWEFLELGNGIFNLHHFPYIEWGKSNITRAVPYLHSVYRWYLAGTHNRIPHLGVLYTWLRFYKDLDDKGVVFLEKKNIAYMIHTYIYVHTYFTWEVLEKGSSHRLKYK